MFTFVVTCLLANIIQAQWDTCCYNNDNCRWEVMQQLDEGTIDDSIITPSCCPTYGEIYIKYNGNTNITHSCRCGDSWNWYTQYCPYTQLDAEPCSSGLSCDVDYIYDGGDSFCAVTHSDGGYQYVPQDCPGMLRNCVKL